MDSCGESQVFHDFGALSQKKMQGENLGRKSYLEDMKYVKDELEQYDRSVGCCSEQRESERIP